MAIVTIAFGGLVTLNGLLYVARSIIYMYELLKFGIFYFPIAERFSPLLALLILAAGIVGLIAGIGTLRLRPWARRWSLVYGGLFVASSVLAFTANIVAFWGMYEAGRLIIFAAIYVVIPVSYSIILYAVFHRPTWRAAFANAWAA